jgi:beta-galactosidase
MGLSEPASGSDWWAWVHDPADPEDEEDFKAARFNSYLWNEWNLNAVVKGDFDMNLDGVVDSEERRPDLAKGCDFIGADYYLRETVKHVDRKGDPRFAFDFVPGPGPKSDTGWEIYPAGLRNVLVWAYRTYRRPIYVTENGVADSRDKLRVDYLTSHLRQVYAAIAEDRVPISGYFYWSLIDNYSWFSGYRSRLGLYSVDTVTKERRPTRGVEVYRRIATTNSLPS